MKLSVSNIAWDLTDDEFIYSFLSENGFHGIEIAPTRIFPENPYAYLEEVKKFQLYLLKNYNLEISSIQSIFYGKHEKIFESDQEYQIMLDYTKKVIDFASASGSSNIVFGCPRNRNLKNAKDYQTAVQFFRVLGEYALMSHTTLSIEPNPVIYHTNFINTTVEAIELVKNVSSEGFKVNLDLGTIIYNDETLEIIKEALKFINHIHISEPGLVPVIQRNIHFELQKILNGSYDRFVSLEMKYQSDKAMLLNCIKMVKEIFQ